MTSVANMSYSPRNYNPVETRDLKQSPNCHFFINGDPFYPGSRMCISTRIKTFDGVKDELTTTLLKNSSCAGSIRNIFTPKNGTRVNSIDELKDGCHYVASINDRFKPLPYKEIGDRTRPPRVRGLKKIDYDRIYQPVYHAVNKHHRELSSKAKKRMAEIHGLRLKVHENGKGYKPCCKVTVDYKQRRDINQVLMEIDKHLDSAPIDRIYKVEGNGNFIEVTDPSDLEMDQHIVAVPKSHKSGLDRFERYNMDGKMNIKVNTAPIIGQPYLHNPFPEVHPYQGKGHNRSFSKYKPLPGIGTKSDGGSPYSNPPTNRTKQSRQPVKEVDYDKDEGGKFRARGSQNQKGAKQEDIRNEKSTPIPPGTELNKQPSKEQKQNAEATNQTNREEKMDENTARSRDRRSPDVSFRRHDLSPQATNQPRSSTPTPRPDSGSKHQQQQKQQQQQKIQKEDEAATRIQAGFRGHNARKEYQRMKAEQNQEGPSKQQQDQQKLQQQQQQQQQQQDLQKQQQQQQQQQKPKTDPTNTGKSKDELDEAASKIQAAFKGHQVRKDMKTKQQGQK